MLINALLSISEICKEHLMWELSWTFHPVSGIKISLKWGMQWSPPLMGLRSRPMELILEWFHSPRMQNCYLILLHPLYHDPLAIKNEVDKIDELYPNTRTDKALILANISLFTATGGDRPDKRNLLFVFTDGKPYPTGPKSGYKPFDVTIPPIEVCYRITPVRGIKPR